MKVAIIRERMEGETRVAASPDSVKKMVSAGFSVSIEAGAGETAGVSDTAFEEAGATLKQDVKSILKDADVLLKVQPPFEDLTTQTKEYQALKKGAIVIGLFNPSDNKPAIKTLAEEQITAFALEFLPRITRGQAMDVLSSQSNLAGYQAVIEGVSQLNKVIPMMTTAAGTVSPAKVLVLGAGVAGLQAIATAKRLGAIVSAFDVRPVVKEQVESLGATFIEVEDTTENAETSGGYAKEMGKDYQKRQEQRIHDVIKDQDLVITTALIPGKPAPELITKAMVQDMKEGAVIVDMAVASGGNCAYSQREKVVTQHGVTIVGYTNLPARTSRDASQLYARNLLNFLTLLQEKESGKLVINMDDELVKGTLITHQGKVTHEQCKEAPLKKVVKKAPVKKTTAAPAKKPKKPSAKPGNTATKKIS